MKKIFSGFKSLSVGLKILVVFTAIVVVAGICTATYMIVNNGENVITTATQGQQEKNKIPEDIIGEITEEIVLVAEEPSKEEEKEEKKEEEKTVKYKDKEITIPKAQVAATNSKEDAEKEKTGGEQMSATEAVDKFENDGQSVGIDVSKHQGKINWAEVKASGIDFAMIRCGFRGQTAGDIYEDAYFKTNVNGAVSNGIKVGIYFYSCAINEEEALQEAAWVVNQIKTYRITYPVVYDFEDFGRYRCSGVSGEQATSNAIAFLEYVKNAGYTPMMYASKNDITNRFNPSRLSSYKFWLAHYTETTNYTGSYQMWQYTSNGSVNGISGRVDMNIAYFRYGAVAEPKHTHDFENGTVINTTDSKAATCTVDGVKYIRCASCSESKKVTLEALGHKYGKWITEKEATEEEEGIKYRECSVCKEKQKEEIQKLKPEKNNTVNTNTITNTSTNTNANTNTITNTTTTTNTTENPTTNTIQNQTGNTTIDNIVDTEKEEHTHTYLPEVTTKETCEVDGEEVLKCSCGDIKEMNVIPATGHKPSGDFISKEDGTFYQVCSECGNEVIVDKSTP